MDNRGKGGSSRRKRERELRKHLLIAGAAVAALLVIVLVSVLSMQNTNLSSAGRQNGADAALSGGTGAVSDAGSGNTQETGAASEASSLSAQETGSAGNEGAAAETDGTGSGAQDTSGSGESGTAAGSADVSGSAESAGGSAAETVDADSPYAAKGGAVLFSDPSYTEEVSILSTGDNLIHEKLYQNALQADGTYDFTPMYTRVKPYIQAADIATVNMETPMATSLGAPSGYPDFNTPDEAGAALIDAGFDVMNAANNHILDMGWAGLQTTLNYWTSRNVPYVGAYLSEDDLWTPRIVEVNGIRVAFLGFLSFTNKTPENTTSCRLVQLDDAETVRALIEDAKAKADVVVVHAHWGDENTFEVFDSQKTEAQNMVDWGADVIFGNHSHTLEPLTVLTRASDGKQCPVIYSMGNFVSGQKFRYNLISGLLTVSFVKNPATGDVQASRVSLRPIVTHYTGDRDNVVIYPLDEYSEELAAENGVKQFEEEIPLTMDYIRQVVTDEIPSQYLEGMPG